MPMTQQHKRPERYFPEKLVTFLGRVTFQKGPDYFVEAAYKVLKKDKNVRFVMAGTGDMLLKSSEELRNFESGHVFIFRFPQRPGSGSCVWFERCVRCHLFRTFRNFSFGSNSFQCTGNHFKTIRCGGNSSSCINCRFWDVDDIADKIYGLLHYQGISKCSFIMEKMK